MTYINLPDRSSYAPEKNEKKLGKIHLLGDKKIIVLSSRYDVTMVLLSLSRHCKKSMSILQFHYLVAEKNALKDLIGVTLDL